ncbi:MAG: MarR family transcriptional regulator [Dehalococcoidia bacterium]|nr:MAG: MarR family transcriptional regulator [Dehalococcoidia bacterium]
MTREDQQFLAMRLYAQSMGIVDPIRMRLWSEAELTTSQLRLLFAIREEPGATLTQLATLLRVSPPTASGLVDRLVRQDYVRRDADPHDRRFVCHHLTESGTAILGELEREGRALLGVILARLSDGELDELVRGLQLLNEAAEAASTVEAR